jgi:3-methyladenine DNA glycosylase AlkD
MSDAIINEFKQNADPIRAAKMSAYMRDKFLFLGVPAQKRKEICKPYFKAMRELDRDFVSVLWACEYRELRYVAMDYLTRHKKELLPEDVTWLKNFVTDKPWWDTIDGMDRIIGDISFRYPEVKKTLLAWSVDENIWLRRIAIDHQILAKEKTDTALLEKVILNNFGSKEFFINKAIGWSLRDYSKTNPEWVREFVEKYGEKMAALSIREAVKYL